MRNFYTFLLLCPLFFVGCEKSPVHTDEIAITFSYPPGDYEIANGSVALYLYALPEFLADAPALRVFEGELALKQLPYSLEIPLEELNEKEYRRRFFESFDDALIYVALGQWDSDNNGTAHCRGDLMIDYNRAFPDVEVNRPNTVYLTTLSNGDCGQ